MTIEAPIAFRSLEETQDVFFQAAATNLGGFLVNQDYDPEILDFRRMETDFWRMIPAGNKKAARSPIVRKIAKDKRPRIGFVSRDDLSTAVENTKTDLQRNLDDPGQEIKAVSATLDFSHFARSMSIQQGRPYGDEIAEDTSDMIKEAFRFLEMSLFNADATVNPLAFNGLQAQVVDPAHIFNIDITTPTPDSIWQKINEVTMRATTNREFNRRISHIMMTGAAYVKFQEEVKDGVLKFNELEVVPGVKVPAVMTGDGLKPIISSPYLDDVPNSGGGDSLSIYLLDMNAVEWHGVYPDGGTKTFEPQIFDITTYLSGQYLVLKRMLLMYGTPYLRNRSLYKINVLAPQGSAWNFATP